MRVGRFYNINTEKEQPKEESICDVCGGRLKQRNDDNIESFRNRYQIYLEKMQPLLDYYKKKGILYVIDGRGSVEEIFQKIKKVLMKG